MKPKIVIVSLLGLLTLLIVYLAETRNRYFDSKVYYGAIQYWFHGDGGMVYDWLRPGTPYGFTYPPFAGLVMSPMAVLPFGVVVVIAVVATVVTTVVLTWWFAGPLIRRQGWPVWFAMAVAVCLAISFEPVRETITFGQVNTLLLTLVAGDLLFGVARGRRWAGVGIGLATAVKLTPGIFIVYLLLTRRWRAASLAAGTAAGATLLAGAVFPDESREFWTSALWDTNRVGVLYYLSNQSERGFLARLDIGAAESKVWLACVLVTLAVWAWRVRRAPDDVPGGLALTGVVGCLISPVTWIHHCVWLIPAIVRCVDAGLSGPDWRTGVSDLSRRSEMSGLGKGSGVSGLNKRFGISGSGWSAGRRPFYLGAAAYLVMTSHVTWLWESRNGPPLALIGANLYVWFGLALLIWTPVRTTRSLPVNEADKISA